MNPELEINLDQLFSIMPETVGAQAKDLCRRLLLTKNELVALIAD